MKVAERTREWSISTKTRKRNKQEPIELDFNEVCKTFESVTQRRVEFDEFFSKKIDVYYEDLAENYANELNAVQEFLGVPTSFTQPSTTKQAQLPLDKAIKNYHELNEKFGNTEWSVFFDEELA
jgi:LPS sulfotransferase NodH